MRRKSISCIIPAYNEGKTIANIIKVLNQCRDFIDEIIVVSDGSTDNTVDEAKKSNSDLVIDLNKNIGKGGAVIEGIKKSKGEILLFLDADLVGLTREHVIKIITPVLENQVDMAIGFLADDPRQNIIPHLSGQRALKREILDALIENKQAWKSGYGFEILINREVNRKKFKTLFLPLNNLNHIKKEKKYGVIKTFFLKFSFFKKIIYFYRYAWGILLFLVITIFIYFIFLQPVNLFLDLESIPEPKENDRILIVVAHPDDELIGGGGYIQRAVKNGSSLKVVFITNGDGNKFFDIKLKDIVKKNKDDFIKEGYVRMKESKKALKFLGLDAENLIFFGFPDRNLKNLLGNNWNIPIVSFYTGVNRNIYQETYSYNVFYTGKNLVYLLEKVIFDFRPNIIITHHFNDIHPDHNSTYTFVRLAVFSLVERKIITSPQIYYFLVHWKLTEFPHPFRYDPEAYLSPPPEIENCYWKTFNLSSEEQKNKEMAINFYKSQIKSPYLKLKLNAFIRKNELFCQEKNKSF